MKTSAIFFFLLTVIAITTFGGGGVVSGQEENYAVYDADGQKVKTNVPYYVSFMTIEYGMWICRMRLGSVDPESCPGQQPVMFTDPNIAPTPVMFVLPSSNSSSSDRVVINESTDLSIKFATPGPCGESPFWRVVNGEVFLSGTELSSDSTFTIQRTDQYYKFTFGNGFDQRSINLSNEQKSKLLWKRYLGPEMEIYFYRATLK
ncbi:hypothetical protein EUTSA_v10027937mg [Eutrema salsugineum]|uniref:Uncharacterized protein n=1 Tax=Eutrema salsugineum TaxID=72664 RepID=V4NK30_EUTSA|nr:uncharacterized protein LOC18022939 [Eutrema salsugineum]ESQ46706.1 hypothetical protein EUTSA_v10027937mg [Eutrema salsugineum]